MKKSYFHPLALYGYTILLSAVLFVYGLNNILRLSSTLRLAIQTAVLLNVVPAVMLIAKPDWRRLGVFLLVFAIGLSVYVYALFFNTSFQLLP